MNKETEVQLLKKGLAEFQLSPDDLAFVTQTEAYIRNKYGIFGGCPSDMYCADFADKFLSFDKQTKSKLFPFIDEREYYPPTFIKNIIRLENLIPNIKRSKLPKNIIDFLESVVVADFNIIKISPKEMTDTQKEKADTQKEKANIIIRNVKQKLGLIVFAKMLSSPASVDKWDKMFKKSKTKTLQLLDNLLFLPHFLSKQYAELSTNPYKQASDFLDSFEQIIRLHCFKGFLGTLPFSYYDVKNPFSDIPANKMDDRLDQITFKYIHQYYSELKRLLPILCLEYSIPEHLQKLNSRIKKHNTTPLHFWARYFCDTFVQVFGKPHYSCVATFISDIFDTCVIDSQVNDLMRKE